jgi:hypothetical protein
MDKYAAASYSCVPSSAFKPAQGLQKYEENWQKIYTVITKGFIFAIMPFTMFSTFLLTVVSRQR